MADASGQTSSELVGHAEELADRRDELQALSDDLESRLSAVLFSGETTKADELKAEIAAARDALADVDRAILGSAPAIAEARAVEAAERRRGDIRRYNVAVERMRQHIGILLEAVAAIPDAAQAAMADADLARDLAASLSTEGASVRAPAEPGRWIKDALSSLTGAAYGYQQTGVSRQARERLAHLGDGLELPPED